jgi:hypothetical protein
MNMPDPKTLGEQVEKAFREAVRKSIERHRRLGIPIAFMQDGKIVVLEPEAISPLPAAAWEPATDRRREDG